jgi:hypothetical protein
VTNCFQVGTWVVREMPQSPVVAATRRGTFGPAR